MRPLSILGAPSSAGAYAPGQEKAPAAFRRHGLLEALKAAGVAAHDLGDIRAFRWRPDPDRPTAMNLDAVRDAAEAVRDRVRPVLAADGAALVIGGDCTIELGVVAAALEAGGAPGLIYIDGDADLNTPATAEGALDWTGVAHLLDLPGALGELAGLGPRRPMLVPDQVLLLGAHEITPPEAAAIAGLDLRHEPLAAVLADPAAAAARAAAWGDRFDRLLIHVDVDVLAFTAFPLSENVRFGARDVGLSLHALGAVLRALFQRPNWSTLALTEINPDHAPDEAETFRALIATLAEGPQFTMIEPSSTLAPGRPRMASVWRWRAWLR